MPETESGVRSGAEGRPAALSESARARWQGAVSRGESRIKEPSRKRRGNEKVREFYREEVRGEARAGAALTNVELITAILECNRQLAVAGLQLRITNGVVSLLTTKVENQRLG